MSFIDDFEKEILEEIRRCNESISTNTSNLHMVKRNIRSKSTHKQLRKDAEKARELQKNIANRKVKRKAYEQALNIAKRIDSENYDSCVDDYAEWNECR